MRPLRLTLTGAVAIASAVALAACGSSNSGTTSPSSGSQSSAGLSLKGLANTVPNPSSQHMGGTLNLTSAEAWEHLDPGTSYFQIDYVAVYATQTPLYEDNPTTDQETPLLASGQPIISPDGKTVTIHIKSGWKWAPPLNRAITSADVAYAFLMASAPGQPLSIV